MKQAIEDDSARLLGAPNRLFISAAIAGLPHDRFTNKQLTEHLVGIKESVVTRNLGQLVSAQVLDLEARGHYRRLPSVYWRFCADLLAELRRRYSVPELRRASDQAE
jgi:hypothetical protein